MPLFIKNIAMKMTFKFVGDRQTSSSISNLGAVKLPPEMEERRAGRVSSEGSTHANAVALPQPDASLSG